MVKNEMLSQWDLHSLTGIPPALPLHTQRHQLRLVVESLFEIIPTGHHHEGDNRWPVSKVPRPKRHA
ncbi:hypothetical protein LDENG_00120690 [Lucifuga dentata]|nr:hypothetical protein LDENG_00120690 [Lucifuga dentata]